MLKVSLAALMVASAYVGIFSVYTLLRYKVKVYTGEYSEYALESSTYRSGVFGGSRTLVSETNEPKRITYTLTGLVVEAVKSLALIAIAVGLGTRLFNR